MRTDALNWALWTRCSFSKTYGRDGGGLTLVSFGVYPLIQCDVNQGQWAKQSRLMWCCRMGGVARGRDIQGSSDTPLLCSLWKDLESLWKVLEFIVREKQGLKSDKTWIKINTNTWRRFSLIKHQLLWMPPIHFQKLSRPFSYLEYKKNPVARGSQFALALILKWVCFFCNSLRQDYRISCTDNACTKLCPDFPKE